MEEHALRPPHRGVCLRRWSASSSAFFTTDKIDFLLERRRNVRSSVADLRVLYAHQMQNLHTQIEGSAKFVPTTPGRHVVAEMDSIFVLNAATYKPMSAVRFVLLDDAVLVARRRRRRNASESDKLVADRCWPLNEMLVLDTKDTASMCHNRLSAYVHSLAVSPSARQCLQNQTWKRDARISHGLCFRQEKPTFAISSRCRRNGGEEAQGTGGRT